MSQSFPLLWCVPTELTNKVTKASTFPVWVLPMINPVTGLAGYNLRQAGKTSGGMDFSQRSGGGCSN